jgi:hypothetical protein
MIAGLVIAYLVVGLGCLLAWAPLAQRDYFAVVGPTRVGRVLGGIVLAALLVTLWPLYARVRHGQKANGGKSRN